MADFNYVLNCANNLTASAGGRLTLSSGTPVLTSAVNSSGTIYYTPYSSNVVPVWNGTGFVAAAFSEISNVLANSSVGSAGPTAAAPASVYDLFVWSNGGTLTLTRGPAWSSNTVRGSAAAIARYNGTWTNSANIQNGPAANAGTYVGTIATDSNGSTVSFNLGSTAVGGGAAVIDLFNATNRVIANTAIRDSTGSWTYNSTTQRPSDGSLTMRASFVSGLDEDSVSAIFNETVVGVSGGAAISIGLDSTNGSAANATLSATATTTQTNVTAIYEGNPGIGSHYLQALEFATATATFYGSAFGTQLYSAQIRY